MHPKLLARLLECRTDMGASCYQGDKDGVTADCRSRLEAINRIVDEVERTVSHVDTDPSYEFTSTTGVPMRCRLVARGARFGREHCFTNDSPIPTLEFYDRRFDHTAYGQFISSYFLTTFLDGTAGINLHGGTLGWQIGADDKREIIEWLDQLAIRGYSRSMASPSSSLRG